MKLTKLSTAALLLLLLTLAGCAAGGAGTATRGNPNLLTRPQLEELNANNLYEGIRRLRPTWLSARGPTSLLGEQAQVVVYLNGARVGGVEVLRHTQITDVQSVEYLNAADATNRYGLSHGAGAILVRTI
jgi:hypothetical protein